MPVHDTTSREKDLRKIKKVKYYLLYRKREDWLLVLSDTYLSNSVLVSYDGVGLGLVLVCA